MEDKVERREYYQEYHGHRVQDLERVHKALRGRDSAPLIFLAGDSSLDNKFWIRAEGKAAIGGYENVLSPPRMVPDIAYWLTRECQQNVNGEDDAPIASAAINAAVEESAVGDRFCGRLLRQDKFVRDHISSKDTLVVSVGGNDIALKMNMCTVCNMLGLICCTPSCLIERGCATPLPCDECCLCGCGTGCLSDFCACPPCGGYFAHLFRTRIKAYIERMVSKTKPKNVVVCMIYYPDERATGSWADCALSLLGYNRNPSKLQLLIRKMFEEATRRIDITGTRVIPVALYDALDGKQTGDYVARVEPSETGGEKMAKLIYERIQASYGACVPTKKME
eukprot:g397.t1